MRIRYMTVFAMLAIFAFPVFALEGEYEEADNGLLGSMQRMAEGQVGFTRLANVLSAVMDDSGIAESELRSLRPGRKIVIDDRYLDPSYHVPKSVVRSSIQILEGRSPGHRSPEAVAKIRREADRKIADLTSRFEKEKAALNERLNELQSSLEVQKENARASTENFKVLVRNAEERARASALRAKKAEDAWSESNKNLFRAFLNKAAELPFIVILFAAIAGAALMLLGVWVHREIYYKDKYFIRPLTVVEEAPDGTKVKFVWDEELGGYTCTLCEEKTASPSNLNESREQGIGIKLENLKKHLSRSRNHSDFRVIGSAASQSL